MTKYTLDQLKEMTNEQRDEIVALDQGWIILEYYSDPLNEWRMGYFSLEYTSSNGVGDSESEHFNSAVDYYHPSTKKEQAWDLMVNLLKVGFLVEYDDGTFGVKKYDYSFLGSTDNKDPLIAVVIASILHLQESE